MVSLLRRRQKRTPIGLDIGTSGVRAVQLVQWTDGYAATRVATSEWQHSLAEDDGVHEPQGRIRSCLRRGEFRGHDTVTALQPPAVEFYTLELPSAVLGGEDVNLAQVVRWEVERLATEHADDLGTAYWLLPPTKVPAPNVISVAAQRDVVAAKLKSCADAGLACVGVDVGAAALARFGTVLRTWSTEEIWGVLDVGYAEARLVLCVAGVPVLVRRAGPGSHAWTERIAESLQLSGKAAEVHKREHGIALTGRGVRARSDDVPGSEVAGILLSTLRRELKSLASEVKRSYEYVLSCYPGCRVADLVLVGGGVAMRNLPEFMSDALGIRVRRASEYLEEHGCRLRLPQARELHRLEVLASAVGLAIGQ